MLTSYNIKLTFKVDNIVVCSTFTILCRYHLCLVLKYSHHLERKYHIHYVGTPQKENKGTKKKMEYRTGEEKENKKHKMIKFNSMYQ